jgi:DNA-binding transcriptional LysR family regulator
LTYMDLSGQSMIVHEKGSFSYQATHHFLTKHNVDIVVSLELSSNRAIIKAVEDGLGIALVSKNIAIDHILMKKLAVLPLPGPPITRKYYIVHHKDKYFSEVFNQLVKRVDQWALSYHKSLQDQM